MEHGRPSARAGGPRIGRVRDALRRTIPRDPIVLPRVSRAGRRSDCRARRDRSARRKAVARRARGTACDCHHRTPQRGGPAARGPRLALAPTSRARALPAPELGRPRRAVSRPRPPHRRRVPGRARPTLEAVRVESRRSSRAVATRSISSRRAMRPTFPGAPPTRGRCYPSESTSTSATLSRIGGSGGSRGTESDHAATTARNDRHRDPRPVHADDRLLDDDEHPLGALSVITDRSARRFDVGPTAASRGILLGRYARCDAAELIDDDSVSRTHLCSSAPPTSSTRSTQRARSARTSAAARGRSSRSTAWYSIVRPSFVLANGRVSVRWSPSRQPSQSILLE